jgi:hypothetical protein
MAQHPPRDCATAVGDALRLLAAGGCRQRSAARDAAIAALVVCHRGGEPASGLVLRHITRKLRIERLRRRALRNRDCDE